MFRMDALAFVISVFYVFTTYTSALNIESQNVLFKIFDPALLNGHGIDNNMAFQSFVDEEERFFSKESDIAWLYLHCGEINAFVSKEPTDYLFIKKSLNLACSKVIISSNSALLNQQSDSSRVFLRIPKALKIHQSVLAYLTLPSDFGVNPEAFALHIDYLVDQDSSGVTSLVADFNSAVKSEVISKFHLTRGLNQVIQSFIDPVEVCEIPSSHTLNRLNGLSVINLEGISPLCLGLFAVYSAGLEAVIGISIDSRPTTDTISTTGTSVPEIGIVQEGIARGRDQVIGVADTGLDTNSCFFDEKKVLQYIDYADNRDSIRGHGTHVCGVIAGGCGGPGSHMPGIASDAKIAFYDIGITGSPYLQIPPKLADIFDSARTVGARVHSNSWSSVGNMYSHLSQQVDAYMSSNPDFLVIVSAGNGGSSGAWTIGNPGTSKNALVVGATQTRNSLTDAPISSPSVAFYSSIGPTSDGRIKPDLVAPGEAIVSASAGAVENKVSCSSIERSGTSNSAAYAAGTALLIRQFFMDSNRYAASCNKGYASCVEGAFEPTGFLLKSLLLHSGNFVDSYSSASNDMIPTSIPITDLTANLDNFQGHGMLNVENLAVPIENKKSFLRSQDEKASDLFVENKLTLSPSIGFEYMVAVKPPVDGIEIPLKVTIAWFDPPSLFGFSSSLLINDIDLKILSPSGEVFWGNGVTGGDDSNPNEQITIVNPFSSACIGRISSQCVYTVSITAGKILQGITQDVALVITSSGSVSNQSVKIPVADTINEFTPLDDTLHRYLVLEKWRAVFESKRNKHSKLLHDDSSMFSSDDASGDDVWFPGDDGSGDDDDASAAVDDKKKKEVADDWHILSGNPHRQLSGGDDKALDDTKSDDFFQGDDDTYLVPTADDWGSEGKDDGTPPQADDAKPKTKDDDFHILDPNHETDMLGIKALPAFYHDRKLILKPFAISTSSASSAEVFDQIGILSSVTVMFSKSTDFTSSCDFAVVITDPTGIKFQIGSFSPKIPNTGGDIHIRKWPRVWAVQRPDKRYYVVTKDAQSAGLSGRTGYSSWKIELLSNSKSKVFAKFLLGFESQRNVIQSPIGSSTNSFVFAKICAVFCVLFFALVYIKNKKSSTNCSSKLQNSSEEAEYLFTHSNPELASMLVMQPVQSRSSYGTLALK